MLEPARTDKPSGRHWFRFSMRSVLLTMLLVATYVGGWLSHKQFYNRNLDENVANAVKLIESKRAEVEVVDELDLSIVKGRTAKDVSEVVSAIDQVKSAAKE
jgi:hypothetical protein